MTPSRLMTAEQGQRIVALALLLLPFLLLYLSLVDPYLQLLAEKKERIADLNFQLERLHRTAAQERHWIKLLKSLEKSQSRNQHYLSGTTPALASAELQEQLKEIISHAGGEITSTQELTTKPEESFTKVSVRIRFSADTPALLEILHGIEANQPLLLIESLNIRPRRGRRRSSRTRTMLSVDRLNVDMQVAGYMATPES